MARPRVLISPWRRTLATALDPECDLFTIAPDYTEAVRRAGGLPIIASVLDADEAGEILGSVDALMLSGGNDVDPSCYGQDNTSSWKVNAETDESDLTLARQAIDRGIPILGVCRGAQIVNIALGGDLEQEIQVEGSAIHPRYREMRPEPRAHRHEIDIHADSRLAEIYRPGVMTVNSLHHQAIGEVAPQLRVTATAPDGVVEAVEGIGIDLLAVQWHPEMLAGEGDPLFADLVARAQVRATMLP